LPAAVAGAAGVAPVPSGALPGDEEEPVGAAPVEVAPVVVCEAWSAGQVEAGAGVPSVSPESASATGVADGAGDDDDSVRAARYGGGSAGSAIWGNST